MTKATDRVRLRRNSAGSGPRKGAMSTASAGVAISSSAIHDLLAACAQGAILGHFRQMAPAAPAFETVGARHFDPLALARHHFGHDVDFGKVDETLVGEL